MIRETTDIAVIGAGPAGVAAAVTAAQAGAKVTLIEEYDRPGGQYYRQPASSFDSRLFPPSVARTVRRGRELLAGLDHPNITLRCNTLAWDLSPDRVLSLYGPEGAGCLQPRRLVVASGAYERVMPFPGWTLPGVMTVGAAQVLLKGQGLLAGQRILIAGTGPLLQLAAVQLLEAGAQISAIAELQSSKDFLASGVKLWGHWDKLGQGVANQKKLMEAGVPLRYGHAVVRAPGSEAVEGVVIAGVDRSGSPIPGTEERLEVDTICLNFGFVPATELTQLAGCQMRFDPAFGALATVTNDEMQTSVRGLFAAGEVRGIGGAEVALLEGQMAGAAAARQLGYRPEGQDLRKEWKKAREAVETLGSAFAVKPGLYSLATDEVVLCRCEEVTAGAVRQATRAGVTHLNSLKAYTRAGMGRCQGRICGPILAAIVALETGRPPEATGPFTARAPVKPVPLGAAGGLASPTPTGPEMEDHAGYGVARVR